MTPEDLRREVAIGGPALSPGGELVAYTRRSIIGDDYQTDIWVVPFCGGEPRRLTRGPGADTKPAFSPSGSMLGFLSDRENGTNQVYVISLDGGEPWRLTDFPRGVVDLAWLVSGGALAVLAHDEQSPWCAGERDLPEEPSGHERRAAPAGQKDRQPTSRIPGRLGWREDGAGLLQHPTHVHLVSLDGAARRLTSGPWFATCLRVSPDGEAVAFPCARRDDADLSPMPQVCTVPLTGDDVTEVTCLPGPVARFSFDPDGTILCLAHGQPLPADDDPAVLYRVRACGEPGEEKALTGHLDRFFDEESETGNERVNLVAEMGRVLPCRVGDEGLEPLVSSELRPVAHCVAGSGGRTVAAMTLGLRDPAPDVYALEPGGPRALTSAGRSWVPDSPLVGEEVHVEGPGGDIQTLSFSEEGMADRPMATVLMIHGGPTWAWPVAPDLDTLMLVAAGYRVLRPNIRGSYDRGRGWVRALIGHWGEVDAEDCHAVLDHFVASGQSDPARLGCMGNSYGGFLVNWLVSTGDRFTAAVSQNGVANQVSSFANSDCGPSYNLGAGLGDATSPAGVELLWKRSPLRNVANIHTPLLLLQAEDDLRCPPADAEQLFVALRWLHRPVDYVIYPGSSHGFAHDGRPDRRVDRAERYLTWFGRHMAS